MPNKANFQKSQMFITASVTMNCNEKCIMDTWSKQTQSKPNLTFYRRGFVKRWNLFCGSSDFYNRTMRKNRDQIYDELLILKCQAGEKAAFEELVERWEKRLWHYAYKVTGSDLAAWDIVQETWVGIIKGIRKLADAAVFPSWAFRILNNKCADWLRKCHLQSKLDSELSKGAQDEFDIKQDIDIKAELLPAAVMKLSPEQRVLLMLRYHEGFDIGDIAEILDVPEGTVKSRLHRTLNQLREMVERTHND